MEVKNLAGKSFEEVLYLNKDVIAKLYFEDGKRLQEIALIMKSTKQNIYGYVKKDSRYLKEAARRKEEKTLDIIKKSETIKKLYYENHEKVIEIAKEVNLSNSTVTYVIKKDKRYKLEKENRKSESLKRNRELSKKIKTKRREQAKDAVIISNLRLLQIQNAISMSRTRKISAAGIIEINLNHYKFNSQKQKLEFDKSCGTRPYDLPKSIGVHSVKSYEGKTYEKNKV